jgi:hypothetical protein
MILLTFPVCPSYLSILLTPSLPGVMRTTGYVRDAANTPMFARFCYSPLVGVVVPVG